MVELIVERKIHKKKELSSFLPKDNDGEEVEIILNIYGLLVD